MAHKKERLSQQQREYGLLPERMLGTVGARQVSCSQTLTSFMAFVMWNLDYVVPTYEHSL